MGDDCPMAWRARLSLSGRGKHDDEHEQWLATAGKYARHLTETGSRCHLNEGSTRFCHWEATVLERATLADEAPPLDPAPQARVAASDQPAASVGVRCTIHAGGRYLDSTARLGSDDFA
jgi:hypothetical protein